jgi:hypothetical protein
MSSEKNDNGIAPLYGFGSTEKLEFLDDFSPSGLLVDQTNDPTFVDAETSREVALEGICVGDCSPQVRLFLIDVDANNQCK